MGYLYLFQNKILAFPLLVHDEMWIQWSHSIIFRLSHAFLSNKTQYQLILCIPRLVSTFPKSYLFCSCSFFFYPFQELFIFHFIDPFKLSVILYSSFTSTLLIQDMIQGIKINVIILRDYFTFNCYIYSINSNFNRYTVYKPSY